MASRSLPVSESLEKQMKFIAQELHDEASQLLAAVYMALDDAARQVEAPSPYRRRVRNAIDLLDKAEADLRQLSHELRPAMLEESGLLATLHSLAQGFAARRHIAVRVEGSTGRRLPVPVELALYRVVQQALTNAAQHGKAKTVTIRLQRREGKVYCLMSDDGVGFNVRAAGARKNIGALGLIGMRERVAAVGGQLRIRSIPGHGSTVLATVPATPIRKTPGIGSNRNAA